MAKKDGTLALTVASSVPDAITAINKKIADLKYIQESVYCTSGKISGANGTIDLKELKTVQEVVDAVSSVHFRIKAKEEAYELLGYATIPVQKVDGGTREEWVKDGKLRIAIIEQKTTLDKLQGFKSRWVELMDKEDQKAMLLKEMEDLAQE